MEIFAAKFASSMNQIQRIGQENGVERNFSRALLRANIEQERESCSYNHKHTNTKAPVNANHMARATQVTHPLTADRSMRRNSASEMATVSRPKVAAAYFANRSEIVADCDAKFHRENHRSEPSATDRASFAEARKDSAFGSVRAALDLELSKCNFA